MELIDHLAAGRSEHPFDIPRHVLLLRVEDQQRFVDGWSNGTAEFIPKDGCMGPTTRVLREREGNRPAVVFVAVDPTPWIQERIREYCPLPDGAAAGAAAAPVAAPAPASGPSSCPREANPAQLC